MKGNLAGGRHGPSLQGMVNAGKFQPTALLSQAKLLFTCEQKGENSKCLGFLSRESCCVGSRKKPWGRHAPASKTAGQQREGKEGLHAGRQERPKPVVTWRRPREGKEEKRTRGGRQAQGWSLACVGHGVEQARLGWARSMLGLMMM